MVPYPDHAVGTGPIHLPSRSSDEPLGVGNLHGERSLYGSPHPVIRGQREPEHALRRPIR
ncbi:hypothetical protein D9M72_629810 [compost metagenome]